MRCWSISCVAENFGKWTLANWISGCIKSWMGRLRISEQIYYTESKFEPASSPLKNATSRSSRGNEAQISSEKEAMREPPHIGCYFLNRLLTVLPKPAITRGSRALRGFL